MSFYYTDPNGNDWDIDSFGGFRVASNSGYSLFDSGAAATLQTISAGVPSTVSLSTGAPTTTATSQTVTATGGGFTLTRRADILNDGAGRYFLRIVETVANVSAGATTARLTIADNLYADSSTTLESTSSGDAAYTVGDDWVVTAATSAYASPYPRALHVVAGGDGSPSLVSNTTDLFQTSYERALATGESMTVVHFYAVLDDNAQASALAAALVGLPSYAVAGLGAGELDTLVNFTLDVTADVTTTLADHQRNLTLTGTFDIDGTGNDRDNVITGNSGANTLTGLGGDDTLNGRGGADAMIGGAGDDVYVVDQAGDSVVEVANQGVDTVMSAIDYDISVATRIHLENVTLLGSARTAIGNGSDNVLIGNALANVLRGNGGADTLDGRAGADAMTGGAGDDLYHVDNVGDAVVEVAGEGVDTVIATVDGYALGAQVENLTLAGAARAGSGNALANVLTGNALDNTLTGGAGDDTYVVDSAADVAIELAGGGVDSVISSAQRYVLGAHVENLTLAETGEAYAGVGNALANRLTGNSRANLLDGGAGADTMIGGAGNDIYVVDNVADAVVETAGGGLDTVRSSLTRYTLGAEIENGQLLGAGLYMTGNALGNGLTGNLAANVMNGLGGDDLIDGGGGNDTLYGGDGDDHLIGDRGGPADVIGVGENMVDGARVSISLTGPEIASGSVRLRGSISSLDLSQQAFNIVYVVDQSGSMSTNFVGSTTVPDLNGDGAANTTMDAAIASFQTLNEALLRSGLSGRINAALVPFSDTAPQLYTGGIGADVDNDGVADIVESLRTLRPLGGTNYTAALTTATNFLSAQSSGRNIVFFVSDGAPNDTSYLTSVLPNLRTLGGGTTIRAIGTGAGANEAILDELDDGIDNNSAQIVTNPEDLDVTLSDLLFAPADGAWLEIYRDGVLVEVINSENFTVSPLGVSFETGALALSASGANRFTARLITSDANGATVSADIDIAVGAFVSNDRLLGEAGNDTLDGGVGADAMIGGTGDDTYHVDNAGDVFTENPGEGVDTVVSRLRSTTLSANLENLTLIGAAIAGVGNGYNNIITGNDADNVLNGAGGVDTLYGRAGNDRLDGGLGDDRMVGGTGDDTYVVDSPADYVIEQAGEGNDVVISSLSVSLGSYAAPVDIFVYNVERLVLAAGSAAVNGVGNDLANTLIGNANANTLAGLGGDDILIGGAGADTLDGGFGDDTFHLQDAGDVLIDSGGRDTVISYLASYTLQAGFERLTLASVPAARAAIGNDADNELIGNTLDNTLNGRGGADRMAGGAGNDTYVVDNAGDRVVEAAGEGVDTVLAARSYMLGANVENLTLLGLASYAAGGNNLANVLIGNSGANYMQGLAGDDRLEGRDGDDRLDGGLGADVMLGGTGDDTYVVDALADVVQEAAGQGSDTVLAATSYLLAAGQSIEFLRASVTGSTAALNLTGNELGQAIYGNAGANVLNGGGGADVLVGYGGADAFVFNSAPGAGNVDRIVDFSVTDDVIWLDDTVFAGIGPANAALAPGALRFGAAAVDADDRILYVAATGQLFFDADGSGAVAAPIEFARVSANLALTANDFFVI